MTLKGLLKENATMLRQKGESLHQISKRLKITVFKTMELLTETDQTTLDTEIPKKQFTKTYHKKHTGTISRADHHGTLGVKYYDCNVVDRLIAIYNRLSAIGV